MKHPRPSLLGVLVIGASLCVAFAGLGSLLNSVYAANGTVHEIRGTVQSISPGDTPPVVVIRGLHGLKEEIVVGAMVQQGATVLRGKKKVALDQIHLGDDVTLRYVKTRDGLAVRSIVLHRK
jgi:ABC-type cobalamin transport system permease subunit